MVRLWDDEGHGGHDSGATSFGLAEEHVVLNLGNRIDWILANRTEGVQVNSTRDSDVFVGLSERARRANDWKADYFNSYHCDSGGGNRYTIYIYTGAGKETEDIAQRLYNEIYPFFKQYGIGSGGVRRENFAVVRETKMHAFLHENGFIDNLMTNNLLKQGGNGEFLDKLAWTYARAYAKVFGFKLHEMGSAPQQPQQPPTNSGGGNVGKMVVVDYDGLNVRNAPSWEDSAIEKQVRKGEAFTILEELDEFFRCKYFYITKSPQYVHVK